MPTYRAELGDCLLRLGDLAGAERELITASRLQPDQPYLYRSLSRLRSAQGRKQEAVDLARRAAALRRGDSNLQNLLGLACVEAGDLEGAITAFRAALALRPTDARLRQNLALALQRAGRSAEARELLAPASPLRRPPSPSPDHVLAPPSR